MEEGCLEDVATEGNRTQHQEPEEEISSFASVPSSPSGSSSLATTNQSDPAPKKDNQRSATSNVWAHYARKPVDGKMKSFCKYCSTVYGPTTSTATLNLHLKKHPDKVKSSKPTLPDCFKPRNLAEDRVRILSAEEQAVANEKLRRWVVVTTQSFSCVESKEFQDLIKCFGTSFEFCTRNTLKTGIIEDFERYKRKMVEIFKDVPGRFSITLDAWTSVSQVGYMVITVHWIDGEWNMRRAVLNS